MTLRRDQTVGRTEFLGGNVSKVEVDRLLIVTLSTEKVEFENEATTTQCNVYQHQIGSHDRFVAATTLQSGLATAATHTTTQKSFLQSRRSPRTRPRRSPRTRSRPTFSPRTRSRRTSTTSPRGAEGQSRLNIAQCEGINQVHRRLRDRNCSSQVQSKYIQM